MLDHALRGTAGRTRARSPPPSRAISSGVSMPGISGRPARDARARRAAAGRAPQPLAHHLDLVVPATPRCAARASSCPRCWCGSRSRSVISIACAWWPIMPCMNFTSAAVKPAATGARLVGVDHLLASPGAPGRMTGGDCATAADPQETAKAAVKTIPSARAAWVIGKAIFFSLSDTDLLPQPQGKQPTGETQGPQTETQPDIEPSRAPCASSVLSAARRADDRLRPVARNDRASN